jgi:conjugal transfer mating pair stabilization protein TraN
LRLFLSPAGVSPIFLKSIDLASNINKVFGICISREKLYCCFNSILARIIQVQGRRQLRADHGISYPWALDDNPYCVGLRMKDFKRLDFSRIDLKEYMNYALGTYRKKVSDKMKQETVERVKEKFQ